jgi:predicted phage tail protein
MAVKRMNFHVAHGDKTLKRSKEVHEHQLFLPRSKGDWHLVPALHGGKGGNGKAIFSIIVGGVLLATGIGGALAAGGGIAGFAATSVVGLSYSTLTLIGASFFLGGINQLLTPTPKTDTSDKSPTSFVFGGPDEVDDEGGPIPIVLGEIITGGVKIASAITSTSGSSLGYSLGLGKGALSEYSASLMST